ncbi:MAG: orotate phosphoribosyltransferase [Dehalococcoidia bacterium]|nr:orotate phosphoribosyltransferase [Dehalococcoidia bacterium]
MKTHAPRLELELDTEGARRIMEIAYQVGAFAEGDFTLSSGVKSDRYFEGQKVTLSPQGAYEVGKAIYDELVKVGVDAVGGLAMGAYPIAVSVAMVSHMEGRPIPSFIVREVPKEHGTRREIEGGLKEGSRVAIVDDVITKGGSILKAIRAVEEANCKVVKVIVIVDRYEGGSDMLREKGYDFSPILGYRAPGEVTVEG